MPGLKRERAGRIAAEAVGPFEATGWPLAEARQRLHFTAAAFEEIGAEVVRALERAQVPDAKLGNSWQRTCILCPVW